MESERLADLQLSGQSKKRCLQLSGRKARSYQRAVAYLVQQQTGIPPIMTQHMQPASIMLIMHSPQAWIIFGNHRIAAVQVIITPPSIISHLQFAIIMLQLHRHIPFIMQQQEQAAPSIIWHIELNHLSAHHVLATAGH